MDGTARPDAPPAAGARVRAEILDAAAGYRAVKDEWQHLAGAAERAGWSSLPEVFRTWHATLRGGGDTRIVVVRDDGGLCGILPIMRDRAWRGPSCTPRYDYAPADRAASASRRPRPIPVRQITAAASMPATMLWVGPLCRPGTEDAVFDAVAGCLLGLRGWDVIVLPSWEGKDEARWQASFATAGVPARVQSLGRVVHNLCELRPFDAIVAGQNKKFRQNVRRARAAAEADGLAFRVHAGVDEVAPVLEAVDRIARASWKHEGRPGKEVHIPYAGPQQVFVEALFATPDLGATPLIATVSDADGPVAVLVGIEHFRTVTALLTFMDGRCREASPGLLLLGHLMDWAVARGAKHFDFNATHAWVRYLADERRTVSNVVVFAPTLAGSTLSWISETAGRLRR